jgi:hypothetical protein
LSHLIESGFLANFVHEGSGANFAVGVGFVLNGFTVGTSLLSTLYFSYKIRKKRRVEKELKKKREKLEDEPST